MFPVINKYVPELSFFANIHEMSAELQEDPKVVLARINSGNVRSRREGSHDLRLFRL